MMDDPVFEITLEVDADKFDHAGSAMAFIYEALRDSEEWPYEEPTVTDYKLRESVENRE